LEVSAAAPRGSGVLPYASPATGGGRSWTIRHGVVVSAVATVVIGALLVGRVRYRATVYDTESRITAQITLVQSLRSQVALFKLQHNGHLPGVCPLVYSGGASSANEVTFWAQMTQYTDVSGNTNPTKSARFCYGPYLQSVPANWLNGSSTVASAPAPGVGFVYDFAGGAGSGKVWGVDRSGALIQQ
jgi:hypothetical protein